LPTILSRSRQFPLQPPQPAAARQWLERQGVPHAQSLLAEFGNAPLAALQAAESEDRPLLQFLLEQLGQGPKFDALATADHLQKLSVPAVLSTMHRWVFDLMAARLAGQPRYFPGQGDALQRCALAIPLDRLERFARALPERRRTEQHPLAARLVIESLLLEYRQLFPAA
jgi:DNA polymerase-3 subunit delta'